MSGIVSDNRGRSSGLVKPGQLSPPTPTSIDDTDVDSAGGGNQTIVITGTNFATGDIVSFIGSSANFNAATTTIDSATQITAVAPKSSFLNAQEPYGVRVTGANGLIGTLASQIYVDNAPTWTTASGNLGTISDTDTGTHATVVASDAEGDTIAYTETGGTVLATNNLSLNSSTGVISGDPTNVEASTTHSFDLRATANTKTADRTFNIIVTPGADGSSAARKAVSAAAIKTLTGTTTDGGYYITDPSDSESAILAYCNMSFDGGGWVLVESSRKSTWDGLTGDQSNASFFDASVLVEYTTGVPHDIYSKLRDNYPFTELLIEWSTNTDMSDPGTNGRPVYEIGSTTGLINMTVNTAYARKSGNAGYIPDTAWGSGSTRDVNYLQYKITPTGHRCYMFSNRIIDSHNQDGFYWWGGSYNSGQWVSVEDAETDEGSTVETVGFYVK